MFQHITLSRGRTRPGTCSSWLRMTRLGPSDGLGGGSLGPLLPALDWLERVGPGLLVGSLSLLGERFREVAIFRDPPLLVGLDQREPKTVLVLLKLRPLSRSVTNLRSWRLLRYHPARVSRSSEWSLMHKEAPQNLT